MTRRTAPFGTWDSPLTPAQMVAQGWRYGYASLVDDGAVWCEQRPDEGGRVVVMRRGRDGAARDLIPPGFNARTRVHEYGGRPFALDGDAVWFTNFADQRLYRADAQGARAVSTGDGWRFAEPVIDVRRGRIVAVGERHAPGGRHPENGLVAVDARTGEVAWLLRGHDFIASPTLSPDGRRLAFVAWEHPTMPWDAAALYVADVRDDGGLDAPVHLAGADGASVNGLLWRDDAALLFALEVDDRWQPHAWEGGAVRRVADVPGELGVPLWTLQAPAFALASRDELVGVSQRDGESLLVSIDLRDGSVTVLRDDLPHVGAVDARGDDVLLVQGYDTAGSALLRVDRARGVEAVIAGAPCEGRRPEALTFPTEGGAVAHGFLHLPDSEDFEAEPGALPPLIVTAHGGPTGAASPLPTPAIRFWTTRGFALLDVSYRGSTGFGRAYRDALRGRWGVADVADCVAGARWLVQRGRARGDGAVHPGRQRRGLHGAPGAVRPRALRRRRLPLRHQRPAHAHGRDPQVRVALRRLPLRRGRGPGGRDAGAHAPRSPRAHRGPGGVLPGPRGPRGAPLADAAHPRGAAGARDRERVSRLRGGAARLPQGRDDRRRVREGARVLPAAPTGQRGAGRGVPRHDRGAVSDPSSTLSVSEGTIPPTLPAVVPHPPMPMRSAFALMLVAALAVGDRADACSSAGGIALMDPPRDAAGVPTDVELWLISNVELTRRPLLTDPDGVAVPYSLRTLEEPSRRDTHLLLRPDAPLRPRTRYTFRDPGAAPTAYVHAFETGDGPSLDPPAAIRVEASQVVDNMVRGCGYDSLACVGLSYRGVVDVTIRGRCDGAVLDRYLTRTDEGGLRVRYDGVAIRVPFCAELRARRADGARGPVATF
jgi:hypothetical protein